MVTVATAAAVPTAMLRLRLVSATVSTAPWTGLGRLVAARVRLRVSYATATAALVAASTPGAAFVPAPASAAAFVSTPTSVTSVTTPAALLLLRRL